MKMASTMARSGRVPALVMFMPDPGLSRARVIFLEAAIAADVARVFAAIADAVLALPGAEPIAREADALLSVSLPTPATLAALCCQRTVLTLAVERLPGDRARVTLTHTGFGAGADWARAFAGYARGWSAALAGFRDALEEPVAPAPAPPRRRAP